MNSPKRKIRCEWVTDDQIYIDYHDKEWGVPVKDDIKLFEFLVLESAQAGLNWLTVLKKRENYRKAFSGFDPLKVARFTEKRVEKLMENPGIIRNEAKIRAAINNAKMFLEVQREFGSFYAYSQRFLPCEKRIVNNWRNLKSVPTTTKESDAFSKDLKKRGFKFIGSTIIYAYMQAVGMVDDHTIDCFCHEVSKD